MSLNTLPHAPRDFDFIIGDWSVKHRRLVEPLTRSDTWEEFDGLSSTVKTLGGYGNLEDNLLNYPAGASRAIALRSYNGDTQQWSIWWLDSRNPSSLDTPVVGAFKDGLGTFFASETLNGRPITVRFTWDSTKTNPTWEQAFSTDKGSTWETNWQMTFSAN